MFAKIIRYLNWFRGLNKYQITIALFFVYIAFLDENNLFRAYQLKGQRRDLKKEIEFYREQINECNVRMEALQSGDEHLEKLAREQYLMRSPGEELFIIK